MFNNKFHLKFIQESQSKHFDIVLITVLETNGSNYNKAGNTMFINSSKESIGVLGGKAVQEEMIAKALKALENHTLDYFEIDQRGPDSTHGITKFLIYPFYSKENYGILNQVLQNPGKTLVRSTQDIHVTSLRDAAEELQYDETNHTFYQAIALPYHILIFGNDERVQPLITIANAMGWMITVMTLEKSDTHFIESADAIKYLKNFQAIQEENLSSYDAAIIISHNFEADCIYLGALKDSQLEYIGLMGNKQEVKKKIQHVDAKLLEDPRIFAPIGLKISNKTPESIALSVCAQIEAKRNGKV